MILAGRTLLLITSFVRLCFYHNSPRQSKRPFYSFLCIKFDGVYSLVCTFRPENLRQLDCLVETKIQLPQYRIECPIFAHKNEPRSRLIVIKTSCIFNGSANEKSFKNKVKFYKSSSFMATLHSFFIRTRIIWLSLRMFLF